MKKQFQSKAVPQGTRTIWRYLGALFLMFTLSIGQMWGTSYIPGTRKVVTSNETIDYATIAGANATTSGKWIVNPRGGTTSGKKYTNLTSDTKGNPDGIVDNIATITSDVNMATIQVPSTAKYNQSGKYVIHMRITGITGIIAHGVTGSSGRGCAIYGQEYTTSLTENTEYGSALASMTRSGNSGSFLLQYTGFTASKEYLITIAATGGDDQLYAIELIAPSCTKPTAPSNLNVDSKSHNSATLVWDGGSAGDNGYSIALTSSSGAGTFDWQDCDPATYTATDLTPETEYTFKVKYYGSGTQCTFSDEVTKTFTTDADPSATTYTVTLVPAGGAISDATGWTYDDVSGNYTREVSEGSVLTLPTFTKANRNFKTWRKSGPTDVTSPITVTADVTLTAVWNATVEQVIYSWESPDGTAVEVGGTAITKAQDGSTVEGNGNVNATLTNVTVAYKAIMLNGKISSNAWSGNYVQITTDEAVKAGDKVKVTACTTKGDTSKKGSAQMRAGTSATSTAIFTDGNSYNDILADGTLSPNTKTFTVPDGVNTSTLTMTRSQSSTNCWVTKLQIIREVLVEEANIRTVTFNYNDGGATASTSVEVASGATVAAPADPTYAHHRFHEWQLGGVAYDFSTAVTADITLVADWTQLYTISFAAGDGTGDAPAAVADKAQGETFPVPANTFTAPASKEFDKWNDGTTDYAPGDTYTVGTANVVLTAQWKALVAKYTVIFKDGDVTLDTKLFDVGSNPSDAEIDKTKPLFTFAAWQKDEADIALDDAFWATVAKDAEVTLTARWAKAYASNADFEAYIIANKSEKDDADKAEAYVKSLNYALSTKTGTTFDANDETNNGAYAGLKIKNSGTVLSWNVAAGKVVEFKAGVMVANGSLSINGGAATTIDGGSTGSGDNFKNHYFYSAAEALYTFTTSNGSAEVVKAITMRDPYTVSFEAHGDADPSALQGLPSVTLPDASNGTASLLGWFDAETGGNKIGDAGDTYIPTANITLHAQWEAISTDHTLSDLKVGGVTVDGFDPAVNTYYVVLPYGTAVGDIPAISATANSAKAKQVAIQQAVWTGDPYNCYRAQANVQAEDESWGYYDVRFSFGPKDGVSIIKVATTGGTNKTVTGAYAGDGDVNLSSNTKMDDGKYIGFILEGTTLQAGDKINVHTTEAANTGGSHIIFYDNMTDKNELYETGEIGGVGDNIFTINAAMLGATTAYVYRSNADNAHKWNGKVNYIEVTRAMDPVLTAITIDTRDGVIDPLDDKHFSVTIPYESDLAALTVVPTVIRNAAHATTPEAVISNEGAWILGDNTYRVMDKDGDYTDYTITLDRDVLKHTVSFNTHGGSAVASEEVEHNAYLASAPTAPTKEDYIFQYWSEDEDGAEVDVTTVQINADKEFHAVWASDGAIKLIEAGAINNVNFYTGAVMGTEPATVSIDDVDRVYAILNSTASSPSGVSALNKLIAYNATTTQTKVMVEVYNSSTSGRNVYIKGVLEGSDEVQDLANIVLDNGTKKYVKSEYFEFNNTANRTIYISVPSSASSVYFLQVKVIESGEPLKKAGEAGYSLNMNKGRMFASSEVIDGATLEMSSAYSAISSSAAKFKETSISFDVAAPVTLTVTAANNKTYYVTKGAAGTDNETAKTGVSEFDLTAGTWYITAGNSEVQFTNIAFEAPKCAEPVIDDEPASNTNVTVGDNLTASVTAHATDGADLAYQWYNADGDVAVIGATTATLTTTTEGTYYVIITASKSGYDDRTAQSQNATLAYRDNTIATLSALSYGGTAITLEDGVYEYNVYLAIGTTDVPALAATATQAAYGATAVPTDATEFVSYEAISTVLVTAEDGVTQKTYTVHFYVDHIYSELVPVTASTTWNWTGASTEDNVLINDVPNKGLIIANYLDGANFEKIEGKEGERAYRNQNGGCYQGTHLHFNTTVAGKVKFYFRAPSSGENCTIYVNNNGKRIKVGTRGNSMGWSREVIVKGDVVIEMENDKAGGGDTRVQQIVFTEDAPDYSRTVSNNIGTLCVDHNVLAGGFVGATFYQIASRSEQYNDKIDFEEVLPNEELKAGEPYIFQSTTGRIDLFYGETVATQPVEVRGMHGVLADGSSLTITEENKMDVYYIQDNKLRDCSNLSSLTLVKNRAYIVMSEVPTFAEYQEAQSQQSNNAPRRRVTLGRDAEQVATGCENLNVSDKPVKMILNGQLFILRGEKMFDATGRLVK